MDISIIIPFYNGTQYLNKIVNMVSKNIINCEDKLEVELLIVNDSPWVQIDKKWETLAKGFNMKVLNLAENVGIQGARIRGIKAATGKYIVMLDQDDVISDDFLISQWLNIGGADVCVANGYLCKPDGDKKIYLSKKAQNKVRKIFYYVYLENRILSPGHCMIKKESIPEEWMEYPLKKNGADDLILWLMMLQKGCRFEVNYRCLYEHIDTGENVSRDELGMAESTYEACEVLKSVPYISTWIPKMMQRKINNDVCYLKTGHDKYWDYQIIELIRKVLCRTR